MCTWKHLMVVAALAVPMAAGCGMFGDDKDKKDREEPRASKSGKFDSMDRQFVEKAALSNMAEMELSRLAQDRSQSSAVKDYAKMMVQDHQTAQDELMTLAKDKGVDLPKELDSQHRSFREELKGLKGKEFDKRYAELMVADHNSTIDLFEGRSQRSEDADVKEYAKKHLPGLKEHKNQAVQLQQQVK